MQCEFERAGWVSGQRSLPRKHELDRADLWCHLHQRACCEMACVRALRWKVRPLHDCCRKRDGLGQPHCDRVRACARLRVHRNRAQRVRRVPMIGQSIAFRIASGQHSSRIE